MLCHAGADCVVAAGVAEVVDASLRVPGGTGCTVLCHAGVACSVAAEVAALDSLRAPGGTGCTVLCQAVGAAVAAVAKPSADETVIAMRILRIMVVAPSDENPFLSKWVSLFCVTRPCSHSQAVRLLCIVATCRAPFSWQDRAPRKTTLRAIKQGPFKSKACIAHAMAGSWTSQVVAPSWRAADSISRRNGVFSLQVAAGLAWQSPKTNLTAS